MHLSQTESNFAGKTKSGLELQIQVQNDNITSFFRSASIKIKTTRPIPVLLQNILHNWRHREGQFTSNRRHSEFSQKIHQLSSSILRHEQNHDNWVEIIWNSAVNEYQKDKEKNGLSFQIQRKRIGSFLLTLQHYIKKLAMASSPFSLFLSLETRKATSPLYTGSDAVTTCECWVCATFWIYRGLKPRSQTSIRTSSLGTQPFKAFPYLFIYFQISNFRQEKCSYSKYWIYRKK